MAENHKNNNNNHNYGGSYNFYIIFSNFSKNNAVFFSNLFRISQLNHNKTIKITTRNTKNSND